MSVTPMSARKSTAEDRLNDRPEDRLERDQWGRPLINPPGGGKKIGYRRASSFGAPLESDFQLQLWGKRQVARGIARREDYALAVTRAEVDLEDEDPAVVKAAKKTLDDLAEAAMVEVASGAKASIGTSAHHIYELIDGGRDPGHVPTMLKADVRAYRELTGSLLRMVSIERFVVHDRLRVAGTLDRAVELLRPVVTTDGTIIEAGQTLIGDVKTSQDMSWAGAKFAVQCLCYAEGTPYDTFTGRREDWGHAAPRTDWALIIHVPSTLGRAQFHWVNLDKARTAADQAYTVYEWRNVLGKKLIAAMDAIEAPEDFFAAAASATSLEELTAAAKRAVKAGAWNEVLKAAFTRSKNALLGGDAA